jgi:MADS-box transcription factor
MYQQQDPQRQSLHPNHAPQQQQQSQQQQQVQNHGQQNGPNGETDRQQQQQSMSLHSSPQPPQGQFHSPPPPQPPKLLVPNDQNKHSSIFTPVEEKVSHLHAHLEMLERQQKPNAPISVITNMPLDSAPRSLSLDIGAAVKRNHLNGAGVNGRMVHQQAPTSNPPMPQRTASTPVIPTLQTPSRSNSLADPKRPKLKVQIPNEPSDDEKTAQQSSPQATPIATLTPLRELPLPSPRADRGESSIPLSAGASGPPNPFARPPPPVGNGMFSSQRSDDTPISALPSRFISDQLLPSPSTYNHWAFDKDSTSNFLPSPLPFQTPINTTGPSFRDEDLNSKRKISDGSDDSATKRVKV